MSEPFTQPSDLLDPDRRLMLLHLPPTLRPAVAALFALDQSLGRILQTTSQPMIGRMRLTWWHEALERLGGSGPVPAEPVLAALTDAQVNATGLGPMIDGWEALLDDALDAAAMADYAKGRGETLFEAIATLLGGGGALIRAAGRGWALADLSQHLSDPAAAGLARQLAREALAEGNGRWPWRLRPLGLVAALARHDVTHSRPAEKGGARRAAIMLAHRFTGR